MRPLVSRGLLLPPLVCAALVLVPAGAAAAAVDAGRGASDHGVSRTHDWSSPVDTDRLLARLGMSDLAEGHRGAATTGQSALSHSPLHTLGADRAGVLQPLLDAVTAIPVRPGEHLGAAEAAAHAKAVEAANATVQERLRNLAATDRSAAGTDRAADPVSDLLATVQSTVDALLKALTSLDLGSVLSAVTGLLGTVIGAVTGLLGGGLPTDSLTDTLPTDSLTSNLPALPTG
ncbi:hypothetical protein ABZ896_03600 [Streptomyces sp. NPDC047072]|uniref:hypothetical protein n=1 Tax=Streptomyces sp. NPDC047072 TaxID=3154809 RepID=UPI0033CBBED9